MASGSSGQGGRSKPRGRYTAAKNRRVTERYTTVSRSIRRSGRGGAAAIPSRWLM